MADRIFLLKFKYDYESKFSASLVLTQNSEEEKLQLLSPVPSISTQFEILYCMRTKHN